jgi:hypothetical protein
VVVRPIDGFSAFAEHPGRPLHHHYSRSERAGRSGQRRA